MSHLIFKRDCQGFEMLQGPSGCRQGVKSVGAQALFSTFVALSAPLPRKSPRLLLQGLHRDPFKAGLDGPWSSLVWWKVLECDEQ